jgi:serine/threonine protein kinase/tetratricopeptide (TPR) repeat protein
MVPPPSTNHPTQQQLAQAVAELRQQLRSGASCRAEDLLAAYPAVGADGDAALELIYTEFVVREQLGQQPRKADWLARFPQWRDDLGELFDVHTAMAVSTPGTSATIDSAADGLGPGSVIGPYKLLEEIGAGGFGVVYLAEQRQPVRRKVAVKVLKPGIDNRQVIARFEAERQALALMDHPNIAKIFDAGTTGVASASGEWREKGTTGVASASGEWQEQGALAGALGTYHSPLATTSGRPYFVMELVKGLSITAYCDQHQLTLQERLELFSHVCLAVQHAHQKGVIHRDLKPSNVLVTLDDGRPLVKVIDFGIAKALGQQLTDKTLVTGIAQLVGTPLYMAPEQAALSNVDVDTRSDVYSLGVLLYELLTGMTPFSIERLQAGGYDELRRILREEEPPRPSERVRRDEGGGMRDEKNAVNSSFIPHPSSLRELDWIVMKCLEKDRDRRYETASALAADVGRYLRDDPVLACPPSAWYRFRKFAGRHKGRLAVAAAAFLAVTVMAASIGWAVRDRVARAADAERAEKERRARVAGQVRDTFGTARALIAENKLTRARKKLFEARAQMGNDRAFLGDLPADMDIADAELDRFQQFLELIDRAHQAETAPLLGAALATDAALAGAGAPSAAPSWERRPAAAVPCLVEALDRYEVLQRDGWHTALDVGLLGPAQVARIRQIAYEELLWLADDLLGRQQDHRSGQKLPVAEAARRALVYLANAASAHEATRALYALRARCRKALHEEAASRADRQLADQTPPTMALDHYLEGQAAYDAKLRAEGVLAFEAALRLEPTHYWSMMRLGYCWCDLGQKPEDFATAVVAFSGCIMQRPDHAHPYYCRGVACDKLQRYKDGIADFTRAIELEPTLPEAWSNRGHARGKLGQTKQAIDDFTRAIELDPKEARTWNMRGAAYLDRLHEPAKALADFTEAIKLDAREAQFWNNLGNANLDMGKLKDAVAAYGEAIQLQPKYYKAWYNRGSAHHRLRQLDEALADLSQAIDLNPKAVLAWTNRGIVHDELHKPDKAVADFTEATRLAPTYAGAWYNRGATYHKLGQFDRAIADYARAGELKLPLGYDRQAWLLATCPDVKVRDGRRAVAAAKKAVAADLKNPGYWQTLAWAHYRAEDWKLAVTAMEKVKELGSPGDSFEWFLLAMAHWQLGNQPGARQWYDQAVAWMEKHAPADEELRRFRTEAAQLLGIVKD